MQCSSLLLGIGFLEAFVFASVSIVLVQLLALNSLAHGFANNYLRCVYPSQISRARSKLKKRLGGYASLSGKSRARVHCPDGCKTSRVEVAQGRLFLAPDEHDILLGVLKKVEAKNGTLATLVAILFGFLGVALQGAVSEGSLCLLMVVALALVSLLIPSFQLFKVIRQIDQYDFTSKTAAESREAAVQHALQEALVDDVLDKERAYRFSRLSVAVTFIALLLSAIAFAIVEASIGLAQ